MAALDDTAATIVLKQEKEDILTPDIWSDFTFIVGSEKKKIQVHKVNLIANSKFFKDLFAANKDLNTLEITDLEEVDAFPLFVKYFYTKEAPTSVEECAPVLILATKYDSTELGSKCWEVLLRKMPEHERQVLTFHMTFRNRTTTVETGALQVLCRFGSKVLKCQQFLKLSVDELRKILVKDDLEVKREIDVFEAVMNWGRAECNRKNIPATTDNLRTSVERLIKLVRFPRMSIQEFSKVVLTNILSLTEVGNILQQIGVKTDEKTTTRPLHGFNAKPRKEYSPKGPTFIVQRLVNAPPGLVPSSFTFGQSIKRKMSHLIKMKSSMSIWMTSFGMNSTSPEWYYAFEANDTLHVEVDIKDAAGKEVMKTQEETINGVLDRTYDIYHVQFKKPAFLLENEWYTLAFRVRGVFQGKRYVARDGQGNSMDFILPDNGGTIKFEFQKAGGVAGIQHFMPEFGFMVD